MQKIISTIVAVFFCQFIIAQETVLPAPPNRGITFIKNANIHTGTGKVIANGVIKINNGKIEAVGTASEVPIPADASITDAKGKEVYPGLILPNTNLGLIEINAVRASNDVRELGDLNPNVRSIVAYNTDSKIINVLRSNGILMANIVPEGSLLAGSSSVVQLDAWTWDDAVYKTDEGMHLYLPTLLPARRRQGAATTPERDAVKEGLEKIESIKNFFRQAKAYMANPLKEQTNIKFESVKGLFEKKQKLYLHANTVKQILAGIDFAKEFGFDIVLVGGSDSWQVADLLKQYNISVILQQAHSLPTLDDDDIDQPYKTAALLQKAGVLFSMSDWDENTKGRNLAFNAGTAVAFGLSKEEALQAITLNAAKILGVSDKAGSIEVGKDANIIISEGDILDIRTSKVTEAFIQGRKIDLTDKQKLLNERYEEKYKLKAF